MTVRLDGLLINDQGGTGVPFRPFVMAFTDQNFPYAEATGTSYAVVAQFIFRGTDVLGIPTMIEILAQREGGSSGDARIFDATNSLQIAELNFTETAFSIIDMGTLTNLPVGEAIFELQLKTSAGGGSKKCRASSILFR